MASQITGASIVFSTIVRVQIKNKHQSSASLAFVREIHRFPFSGVIMYIDQDTMGEINYPWSSFSYILQSEDPDKWVYLK